MKMKTLEIVLKWLRVSKRVLRQHQKVVEPVIKKNFGICGGRPLRTRKKSHHSSSSIIASSCENKIKRRIFLRPKVLSATTTRP